MVDTPEEGFEYLQEGLTRFHLNPPKPEKAPEIAKTRP
jgi:hypothetical protein